MPVGRGEKEEKAEWRGCDTSSPLAKSESPGSYMVSTDSVVGVLITTWKEYSLGPSSALSDITLGKRGGKGQCYSLVTVEL